MAFSKHYIPLTYNTVSDMVKDTKLKVGMVAKTLGYYSVNDSGGAIYKIYASSVKTKPGQQKLATGNIAQIVYDTDYACVNQFGAYGDGIHDDTDAIEGCFSAFNNIRFAPGSTYILSRPITNLKDDIHIDFNGSTITSIDKISSFFRFTPIDDGEITTPSTSSVTLENGIFNMKSKVTNGIEIQGNDAMLTLKHLKFIAPLHCGVQCTPRNPSTMNSSITLTEVPVYVENCIVEGGTYAGTTTYGFYVDRDTVTINKTNIRNVEIGIFNTGAYNRFTSIMYAFNDKKTVRDTCKVIVLDTSVECSLESARVYNAYIVAYVRDNAPVSVIDLQVNYEKSWYTATNIFYFEPGDIEDTSSVNAVIRDSNIVGLDTMKNYFSNLAFVLCKSDNVVYKNILQIPMSSYYTELMGIRTNESKMMVEKSHKLNPSTTAFGYAKLIPATVLEMYAAYDQPYGIDTPCYGKTGYAYVQGDFNRHYQSITNMSGRENLFFELTTPGRYVTVNKRSLVYIGAWLKTPVDLYVTVRNRHFTKDGSFNDGFTDNQNNIAAEGVRFIPADPDNHVYYSWAVYQTDDSDMGDVDKFVIRLSTKSVTSVFVDKLEIMRTKSIHIPDRDTLRFYFAESPGGIRSLLDSQVKDITTYPDTKGYTLSTPFLDDNEVIISSIPWIKYLDEDSMTLDMLGRNPYVDIDGEPCGFRVSRTLNNYNISKSKNISLKVVDVTRFFDYDTTWYFGAYISHTGIKVREGAIVVEIDGEEVQCVLKTDYPSKHSVTIPAGYHTVVVKLIFSDNDATTNLQMIVKNLYITESPDEEVYSTIVTANEYVKIPVYTHGLVVPGPVHDNTGDIHDKFLNSRYGRGVLSVVHTVDDVDYVETVDSTVEYIKLIDTKTGVEINPETVYKKDFESTWQVNALVQPSDITASVNWSSSDTSIATVEGGIVTFVGIGTCTIRAELSGMYREVKIDSQIWIDSLAIVDYPETIAEGEYVQFKVKYTPENTTMNMEDIKWKPENDYVFHVSNTGVVYGYKNGISRIIAEAHGLTAKTHNIRCIIPLTGIDITYENGHDGINNSGEDIVVKATPIPANTTIDTKSIEWAVEDTSIASQFTQSSEDVYKASFTTGKFGTTNIIATIGNLRVSKQMTVGIRMDDINVSDSELTLDRGSTYMLKVNRLPADTTDSSPIYYHSEDTSIVEVGLVSGTIRAVGVGTTNVVIACGEYTKTCVVTVTATLQSITLSCDDPNITSSGGVRMVVPTYIPADTTSDKTITWTSSNANILEVSSDGVVTAKRISGNAIVYAKCGNITATMEISVNITDSNYRASVFSNEVASIQTLTDADINAPGLLYITDTLYWASDNGSSYNTKSLSHLANVIESSKVIKGLVGTVHGGNVTRTIGTKTAAQSRGAECQDIMSKSPVPMLYCTGRYDYNDGYYFAQSNPTLADVFTDTERNALYVGQYNTGNVGYYYADDVLPNTRIIVLNTSDTYVLNSSKTGLKYNREETMGIGAVQMNWFVDTLKSAPNGSRIIVFGNSALTTYLQDSQDDFVINDFVFREIVKGYNNKSSCSVTNSVEGMEISISTNFSSCKGGKVVCVVSGDTARSSSIKIDGVMYVSVPRSLCTAVKESDVFDASEDETTAINDGYNCNINVPDSRTVNTPTEDVFEYIQLNEADHIIRFIRFGGTATEDGNIREFTFED